MSTAVHVTKFRPDPATMAALAAGIAGVVVGAMLGLAMMLQFYAPAIAAEVDDVCEISIAPDAIADLIRLDAAAEALEFK